MMNYDFAVCIHNPIRNIFCLRVNILQGSTVGAVGSTFVFETSSIGCGVSFTVGSMQLLMGKNKNTSVNGYYNLMCLNF